MRRTGFLLLLSAVLSVSALSQRADLSGLKFCIDPGHGGHNASNDRHVVPDPGIDFWESESNFQKALLVESLLKAEGATVYLTRYTNDYPTDDEPSLAARWQFANANNVDWFHSIHSNAAGGTNTGTNYTLMLVKEKIAPGGDPVYGPGTGQPEKPEAWTMAGIDGPKYTAMLRTMYWTRYLDFTFYGTYNLGVLRGLAMPGVLSEGSFHDFFPETRRLMNNSYRKMEAYALRDAFMQYYAVPSDPHGIIAGILTSNATGAPVNGVSVRLLPANTVYNGDSYNNGFYLFDGLAAGTYRVRFETPGFRLDSVDVTVAAGATVFIDRILRSAVGSDTIPPAVVAHYPGDGQTGVAPNQVVNITFNKTIDPASVLPSAGNIVLRENGTEVARFAVHLVSNGKSGVSIWPYFPASPPLFKPGTSYTVVVSGVKDAMGNVQSGVTTFSFTTANVSLQTTAVDSMNANLASWGAPAASLFTSGIVTDSVAFGSAASPRIPIVSPNLASAKLTYVWSPGAGSWFLDLPVVGGAPHTVLWSSGPARLQAYLNGDASGMLVRFAVDDSVDAFPGGTPTNVEVSPWKRIDWVGWRLLEWDFASEPPAVWVGNGVLEGMLRLHGLQFSRDTLTTAWSGVIHLDQLQLIRPTSLDGVADVQAMPQTISLFQNFPNPFNPGTVIRYELHAAARVKLMVFDALGREVVTLVDEDQGPGIREARWNALNVPSGVYYCRLQAGSRLETRKMIVLK